jgi:NDP-sugar pyrophosphorylase family protein
VTPNRRRSWKAGVIAAGRGERLRHGAHPIKPLVLVNGRTLIECVLASLGEVRPSEVVIIVNEASVAVREHVNAARWPFAVRWIVETTPSSMHSFLRVVETLAEGGDEGPFLVSTVDTIAPPGAFAAFAAASERAEADVTLAVSTPSEDEKPLFVQMAAGSARVEAIGPVVGDRLYSTAGYYAVRASVLREAAGARRDGVNALRLFLERLLTRGYTLDAVPVAGGIDVDRPDDIQAAEALLKQVRA